MKKLPIIAIVLVSLTTAAVSCTEEVDPETLVQGMTFTARFEHDILSRTALSDNGVVLWSPKEEVSVFMGSGTYGCKFTSQNSAPAETVELKGSFSNSHELDSDQYFWAVYPYNESNTCDGQSVTATLPAAQTVNQGTNGSGCHPAIARTRGNNLSFYAIAGGVELTVTSPNVRYISIKGNNDETIAGTFKATFGSDGKPVVETIGDQKTVTLATSNGSAFTPGEKYVISLLPVTFEKGTTIILITDDDKSISKVSNTPQTIESSVFKVVNRIDSQADWETYSVTAPDAVDLGLSVQWASFNLGAANTEEYGDYFAWGETEPYYLSGYAQSDEPIWKHGKESGYHWTSYKWSNGERDKYTKYCSSRTPELWGGTGQPDNLTGLEPDDDAATVHLGRGWRMPTWDEWEELDNECTWTWTDDYNGSGVKGYIVTSNKSGYTDRSIFLPASGRRLYTSIFDFSVTGNYLYSPFRRGNYGPGSSVFASHTDGIYLGGSSRYGGYSFRPVKNYDVSELLLEEKLTICEGRSAVIMRRILPMNATNKAIRWTSSDPSVVTVDNQGKVRGLQVGTAKITAITDDGGYQAECLVTVEQMRPLTALGKTFVAVDLGLSVKWASFNLGATKPSERGDYFAWGETEPYYKDGSSPFANDWKPGKEAGYAMSSYKWWNSNSEAVTKYCPSYWPSDLPSEYKAYFWGGPGSPDGIIRLEPEDDAATVLLGGLWRMPTKDEMVELWENCTWYITYPNVMHIRSNKPGYTNSSIDLPPCSSMIGVVDYNAPNYWSSCINCPVDFRHVIPNFSMCMWIDQMYDMFVNPNAEDPICGVLRCQGLLIRPVTE